MIGKSKVLDTSHDWYDEIDGTSFYEINFQEILLSKIHNVYPDFLGVKFSMDILNDDGEKSAPDLAIIRKDYLEWYVIEVEMTRHSWDDHVEKQVRVFSTGIYPGKKIAKYLKSKNDELNEKKLEEMIDNFRPKVLVIVNEENLEWGKKIKRYNALLSVFQIYRGTNGFEVFRVAGDTPLIYRDRSHCKFTKGSSNILEVSSPEFITQTDGSELEITFKGRITKWKKKEAEGKTYLIFVGQNNLQLEKQYVLFVTDSGDYYIDFN
jgi:hypothetical protein